MIVIHLTLLSWMNTCSSLRDFFILHTEWEYFITFSLFNNLIHPFIIYAQPSSMTLPPLSIPFPPFHHLSPLSWSTLTGIEERFGSWNGVGVEIYQYKIFWVGTKCFGLSFFFWYADRGRNRDRLPDSFKNIICI